MWWPHVLPWSNLWRNTPWYSLWTMPPRIHRHILFHLFLCLLLIFIESKSEQIAQSCFVSLTSYFVLRHHVSFNISCSLLSNVAHPRVDELEDRKLLIPADVILLKRRPLIVNTLLLFCFSIVQRMYIEPWLVLSSVHSHICLLLYVL